MAFTFHDAEPVKRNVPGRARNAEPNPFEEIINVIALRNDDDGKPLAKAFDIDYGTWEEVTVEQDGEGNRTKTRLVPQDDKAKEYAKALRQLTEAGALAKDSDGNPRPVTVNKHVGDATYKNGNPIPGKKRITFWTVEKVSRNRKGDETPATPEETAAE